MMTQLYMTNSRTVLAQLLLINKKFFFAWFSVALFFLVTGKANAQCTSFNVDGGGTLSSTVTSFPITLSGSQTGVSYQLMRYGVASGTPVAGTGSALTWASQNAEGPYMVIATGGSCSGQQMSGTATITLPPANVYSVQWTSPVGVSISGNTVTKTGTINGYN